MTEHHDVIVVGLGGIGSAACRHLAAAGLRVLGLEQFEPVHSRGSSHGLTRGVWQAYFMGPGYVPLLRRAYELWDDLSVATGLTQFVRTGGICIGPPDGTLVPAALASAQACGLTHELLDSGEIHRRFPNLTPDSGSVGVFDPSSGYVRPEQVVRAHLDLAAADGAQLRFGEAVLDLTSCGGSVRVRTTRGNCTADKVVVATGAWLPRLLPAGALPISVVRKVMTWFEPITGQAAFAPHRQPYWIWEAEGRVGYGHPAVDGDEVGVKAGFHDGGEPTDPDAVDRVVPADEVETLRAFLRTRIPDLAGRDVSSLVCLYDNTPDLGFLVGALPGDDAIVVAAGTSGHGFKFVPALGEAVAQLVTTGTATQDLSLFDVGRFTSGARPPKAAPQPVQY